MRLIDADDLERSAEFFLHSDGGIHKDSFYAMLNIMPTLSDVKHGHWIEIDDDNGEYKCSACGESWVLNVGNPAENCMKYCSNCGTKMDE